MDTDTLTHLRHGSDDWDLIEYQWAPDVVLKIYERNLGTDNHQVWFVEQRCSTDGKIALTISETKTTPLTPIEKGDYLSGY